MFLELNDPDGAPRRVHVPGPAAVIGRSPSCDLVIEREFVSKRHLHVFEGLVAVDLSTNGIYLGGEKVVGGALLDGRPIQIGRSAITLNVRGESDGGAGGLEAATIVHPDSATPEVEMLREEVLRLRAEAAEALQAAGPSASKSAPPGGHQIRGLERVIQQLRKELEAERARSKESEFQPGSPSATPESVVPPAADLEVVQLREVIGQLKNQNSALKARVEAAEAELKAVKAAPPAPEEPADNSAAGLLVFKLQREVSELKKKLQQAQASPTPASSSGQVPPQSPSGRGPGDTKPSPIQQAFPGIVPPARDSVPGSGTPASRAAGGPSASEAGGSAIRRLQQVVTSDIEAVLPIVGEPLVSFLLVEGYRTIRQYERVVTRCANALSHMLGGQTMVPGMQGNLRDLLAAVLQDPTDDETREALMAYQRELARWLVVALGAYRESSIKFVESLRDELTPEKLVGAARLPKKRSDKFEADLWRRASAKLQLLQTGVLNERLDEFARSAADRLQREEGDKAF